ncbi:MAG: glycosyltransferase family 87 protein [Candidatus Eisenbacteria bacterium]
MSRLFAAALLVLLLVGGTNGTLTDTVPEIRKTLEIERGTLAFYDFRLFNSVVIERQAGEPLYQIDDANYFAPGSPVYKYPPPYAALLSFDADRKWRPVATKFALYDLASLLLTWLLLAIGTARAKPAHIAPLSPAVSTRHPWSDPRSGPARSIGLLCLLAIWKPFWESLAGIQLEPLFLPFFALAFLAMERGHDWVEGVAIGASSALKIYPALLGLGPLAERRWKSIGAGIVAGVVLLAFGAWRFSWGETWYYFSSVLPKLGGTSVAPENLSILGRLGIALLGSEAIPENQLTIPTLESIASPAVSWAARIGALMIVGLMVAVTVWTLRRVEREQRGPVRLGLTLPLLLLASPTSWFDYQTLLFVPAAWLFLRLPFERDYRAAWTVLLLSILPLVLLDANAVPAGEGAPGWLAGGRMLGAFGLWVAFVIVAQVSGRLHPPSVEVNAAEAISS